LPARAVFTQGDGDMWDPASRASAISSATRNKLYE